MKILDLNIIDPRTEGAYLDPWIELRVDEEVEETDDARYGNHAKWRVIPCGPFIAVEYKTLKGWSPSVDLGRFNTLGMHREQLIEVRPHWDGGHDSVTMGVARAKRLIRKYAPDWHIIVNETAAMNGRVAWRVERIKLLCFGRDHGLQCTVDPITTMWYGGAHINLCKYHKKGHNDSVRDQRVANY